MGYAQRNNLRSEMANMREGVITITFSDGTTQEYLCNNWTIDPAGNMGIKSKQDSFIGIAASAYRMFTFVPTKESLDA